jgi:hypothetical protein
MREQSGGGRRIDQCWAGAGGGMMMRTTEQPLKKENKKREEAAEPSRKKMVGSRRLCCFLRTVCTPETSRVDGTNPRTSSPTATSRPAASLSRLWNLMLRCPRSTCPTNVQCRPHRAARASRLIATVALRRHLLDGHATVALCREHFPYRADQLSQRQQRSGIRTKAARLSPARATSPPNPRPGCGRPRRIPPAARAPLRLHGGQWACRGCAQRPC